MQFLRDALDKVAPHFEKGGKLERFHALYELQDTGIFTPPDVTKTASHVRDGLDLKRLMITVVLALQPIMVWAAFNTGYQANRAILYGATPLDTWQTALLTFCGFDFTSLNPILCTVHGLVLFLPIFIACFAAGAIIEPAVAIIRGHEVNEGFLVTGFLLPLTLPPTIPIWQCVLGMSFGIIFGKEVFGGTGKNFLNPALVGRAFLFFAYPASMSGEAAWIAADFSGVDSFTGATLLAQAAVTPGVLEGANWWQSFWGLIPGSMGETSTAFCLFGAGVLILTKVGSWRTMAGVVLGTYLTATLLNFVESSTNPMFSVPFYWHMVTGGWAFGMVFMATDPVSSAFTNRGKLIYGFGIGMLVILIRVVNPAYPEGMMLAILFMNMFAPLIDHYIVQANIKRRAAGYAA
jgi:Na+-transporting NADH:ubiquinone oxidoreductase subunit B